MINRRKFFSGLWRPSRKRPLSRGDRSARYMALETHVRTDLYPYDFELTEDEESQLLSRVRDLLEEISDEDLFSTAIVERLNNFVQEVIEPWREANAEATRHGRIEKS